MTYTLERGSVDSDAPIHLTGEVAGDKVELLGITPQKQGSGKSPTLSAVLATRIPHPLAKEAYRSSWGPQSPPITYFHLGIIYIRVEFTLVDIF